MKKCSDCGGNKYYTGEGLECFGRCIENDNDIIHEGLDVIHDTVNKPKHYNQGTIEVLDFIMDQEMGYLQGNITKYICRYKHKNGLEDLKKAKFYLNELIEEYGENNNNVQ